MARREFGDLLSQPACARLHAGNPDWLECVGQSWERLPAKPLRKNGRVRCGFVLGADQPRREDRERERALQPRRTSRLQPCAGARCQAGFAETGRLPALLCIVKNRNDLHGLLCDSINTEYAVRAIASSLVLEQCRAGQAAETLSAVRLLPKSCGRIRRALNVVLSNIVKDGPQIVKGLPAENEAHFNQVETWARTSSMLNRSSGF